MKKILTILITLTLLLLLIPINTFVVENMYTDELYIIEHFKSGDTVTVRWIHSVELEPWEEIFTRSDSGEMLLLKTRFKAFGAGVPDSAGEETYIEDDYVVYDKINQVLEDLTYGVSPIAQHTLITKNNTYPLFQLLPADTGIRLKYEKMTLATYIKKRIRTFN